MRPTWYGYSVGKWDGDTFVVDTLGFNDLGWLDAGGHDHSERAPYSRGKPVDRIRQMP